MISQFAMETVSDTRHSAVIDAMREPAANPEPSICAFERGAKEMGSPAAARLRR